MSADTVTIRECIGGDVATILSFVRKKAAFDASLSAQPIDVFTSEAAIAETLFGARPFAYALFAVRGDDVVGFAMYYFRYSSFKGRPSLWLDDLFVNEGSRGCGVGRELMEHVARIALSAKCSHMSWTANVRNARGLAFYHRIGAREVSRKGDSVTLQLDEAPVEALAGLSSIWPAPRQLLDAPNSTSSSGGYGGA